MSNSIKKGVFKFPVAFFKKVLRDYSDWKFAFIRECLQNSIDAKSKNISIDFIKDEEGFCHCIIKDDGIGMTQDILETYFLSMGESNKICDGEQTGGFGVASLLITQPHKNFVIKSFDYVCSGSNGSYEIEKSNSPMTNGVFLDITFDQSEIREFYSLEAVVKKWAKYANIPSITLTLNDEKIDINKAKFDYKFNTELGEIQFSDDHNIYNSCFYVRINKQPMFCVSISTNSKSVNFVGVLDLNGSSLEYLTSNRDGLQNKYSEMLYKHINELTNERTKYKLHGNIDFVMNKKQFFVKNHDNSYCENSNSFSGNMNFEKSKNQTFEKVNTKTNLEKNTLIEDENVIESKNSENNQISNIFIKEKLSFDKKIEKIAKKLEKINESGYPDNFKISLSNNIDSLSKNISLINQKRTVKLANNITKYAQIVFDVIINNRSNYCYEFYELDINRNEIYFDNKKVIFGFIFNDDARGVCSVTKDSLEIKINPTKIFDIEDFDKQDLIEILIHEISHFIYGSHGEDFDGLYTKICRLVRKKTNLKDF